MNTCYDYIESKRMALVIYNYNSMHRKTIPESPPGIAAVFGTYFAAFAARMDSMSSGTTLNRSPTMP